MMKYNLSSIMKRAWELIKEFALTRSEGMKKAWAEAKNPLPATIKMNVCRKEIFTINTLTGIVSGYTYHAKEWLKDNFNAKWDSASRQWTIAPEKIAYEFSVRADYYKLFAVKETAASASVPSDTLDPNKTIKSKQLVDRWDAYYIQVTYTDNTSSLIFAG